MISRSSTNFYPDTSLEGKKHLILKDDSQWPYKILSLPLPLLPMPSLSYARTQKLSRRTSVSTCLFWIINLFSYSTLDSRQNVHNQRRKLCLLKTNLFSVEFFSRQTVDKSRDNSASGKQRLEQRKRKMIIAKTSNTTRHAKQGEKMLYLFWQENFHGIHYMRCPCVKK